VSNAGGELPPPPPPPPPPPVDAAHLVVDMEEREEAVVVRGADGSVYTVVLPQVRRSAQKEEPVADDAALEE
jgi:hypothetical protein